MHILLHWICYELEAKNNGLEGQNLVLALLASFSYELKSTSNSIMVQRVLLDFGFKKLFNKRLAFPPLYRDFYVLLVGTSKDHWVTRMLFVL